MSVRVIDLRALYVAQAGRCFFCGLPMDPRPYRKRKPNGWTRDHFEPGNDETIVLAHLPCNMAKADRQPSWRELFAYSALIGRCTEIDRTETNWSIGNLPRPRVASWAGRFLERTE